MLASFDRCVGAIAEVVARNEAQAPTPSQIADVAQFLKDVHGKMPDHLRLAFRVLTLAFDASALARHARPFHRLPFEARARQVDRWARTSLPFAAGFIAFHVTFGIFYLASDHHGADHAAALA